MCTALTSGSIHNVIFQYNSPTHTKRTVMYVTYNDQKARWWPGNKARTLASKV